jgi:NADH dehydrogenase/NADH oxidase (H2O2-forming)
MPEAKPVKMKLVADKKTLRVLGAQVVSGNPVTDKVDIITLAIQNKLTVNDLAGFSYSAQPYQSFFPANNLIVACAEDILSKVGV